MADVGAATAGILTLEGFNARHGFTTRRGGVSEGAYASLNLGLSSGDDPAKVGANRDKLVDELGVTRAQVCGYHQVHGDKVMRAAPGWFDEQADAAVSDDPELLLVVSAADCFPVLFHDPMSGAVGAAHCGWRGTTKHIARTVVAELQARFGSAPGDLEVAIGQGIMGTCYQVATEVGEKFMAAGFPPAVLTTAGRRELGAPITRANEPPVAATAERPLLDILAAIRFDLGQAGVRDQNVRALERCTHCEADVFYSHRRDAGLTGRMWGFVQADP
ncbi:MAG TPA: peptidoglycan editing factor PgeF [Trueperaceae bacterium]|nr:peptidoglycan editing factor PgeF [Trueperaceae bacterium]